jgi:hypothetical protein
VTHLPSILCVPGWECIPHLVHGFLGRRGGVSRGTFAELNLSRRVGDDPESVDRNWRRVTAITGGALRFVTMRQVHGTEITIVDEPGRAGGDADVLVTRRRGVALSVLTADCVPLLWVAPAPRVIAATHAGWRGTLAGIAERTLQCLQSEFGVELADVSVALGPAIGACCYEVDSEIVEQLQQRWGVMPDAVRRAGGAKPTLDLRAANTAILTRLGVPESRITTVGPCTRCAASQYFSYRAARGSTGRQLSFIGWEAGQ